MSLDLAFFSFNRDQHLLLPGLKSAVKHVPDVDNIILVWDDYVREQPINFEQVQQQLGHPIKIVRHTDLDPWPTAISCWGWIKQQLVKLRCFEYSAADQVFIVDGDVLFTGDPELFQHGRPVLRYDNNQQVDIENSQYHDFIKKYFGIEEFYPYSWVGSTCLFDTNICREIWSVCLQRNQKTLTQCVNETVMPLLEHKDQNRPFSEFELYGNYCYTHKLDKVVVDKKNWNMAPGCQGVDLPIQVKWQFFAPDVLHRLLER